ncbi:MAG: PorV/PorQ family protein [Elusimicrobiota bacterium]
MSKFFIALSCVAVLLAQVFIPCLEAGSGTTGAQFLKIAPAARPLGMGGAYSAMAEDSNAVYYNPAGLSAVSKTEVGATYLKYFQDINYGFLSAVIPLKDSDITAGGGITYLIVPDIEKRSATNDTLTPDGRFNATDTALTLSLSHRNPVPSVLESLALGANLKLINQTIDDKSAFAAALDIGGFYKIDERFSVAVGVVNISNGVKFIEKTDPLPLALRAGTVYRPPVKDLTVALDIDQYFIDQKLYASVGAEYLVVKILCLRAGYKYGYDIASLGSTVGLAGGIGFKYYDLGIDYAFLPFGDLGDTHRVSFSLKFP